jgi:magnesium chelatase family protein
MPANGIDTQAIRLDSMRGNEHVKRAVEVAAVQNHAIVFMTHRPNRPTAEIYAAWLAQFGNEHTVVLEPCYCGHYGDVYHQCECQPRAIRRWENRTKYRVAKANGALWVEISYVPFEKLVSARKPESDETILARIERARFNLKAMKKAHELDGASQRLLQAAMRQLALTETQINQMLSVTTSIAALDNNRSSNVVYLAEALQYRTR